MTPPIRASAPGKPLARYEVFGCISAPCPGFLTRRGLSMQRGAPLLFFPSPTYLVCLFFKLISIFQTLLSSLFFTHSLQNN